ncbi:MAG: hypothetical protein AAGA18_05940 [Verrucomicrobiota bacterium]
MTASDELKESLLTSFTKIIETYPYSVLIHLRQNIDLGFYPNGQLGVEFDGNLIVSKDLQDLVRNSLFTHNHNEDELMKLREELQDCLNLLDQRLKS